MKEKQLKIYFTSDVHGYFYPTTYGDSIEKNMGLFKCSSQYVKDGNTLIIDGGDMLQGSAFVNYCEKRLKSSEPIANVMNAAGYDFITLGNHDFNYGMEYLTEYINALNATCVCQNLIDKEKKECIYPYAMKQLDNGLTVGIVGIVTDYVNVWEKKENIESVLIVDPLEAAKKALEKIKNKVDITICVYHGGFERDITDGRILSETKENIAYLITQQLDFDILLTGHQHIPMAGKWLNGTYIVQTPEKASQFIQMEASYYDGKLRISSELKDANGSGTPEIASKLNPIEEKVQLWLDETVGVFHQPLLPDTKVAMAANGSLIADFVNQVQLFYSDAQISVTSLANDINGFLSKVTIRDIIATYPYPNTLVVMEITGAKLKKAIERSAEYFEIDEAKNLTISKSFLEPKVEHYNYDYYAGVHYVIDVHESIGKRVVDLTYNQKPVVDTDIFTVCLNNYRASGAGGYEFYQDCKVIQEINIETVEMIIDYFEKHKLVQVNEYSDYEVIG